MCYDAIIGEVGITEADHNRILSYIQDNLQIQDKAGALRPLIFNPLQLRLVAEIRRQQAAGLPVRIIILKARQIGFSTAVAALFYQRAATVANTNAMIVAHKADASANIFNKCKLFWDCSPASLRPMKKASNSRELLFENPSSKPSERERDPGLRSRIEIETAGNKDAGRSATVQLLHLSELAYWPHDSQAMASLLQAVPPLPETMVIIESTANGVGGAFYREWQRANRGESVFAPLFFPWQAHREYRLAGGGESWNPLELELAASQGLDQEQLRWRRWCLAANCGGDEAVFSQEYPATAEEAFLTSGRPVFNQAALSQALAAAAQPQRGRLAEGPGRPQFVAGEGNFLSLYAPPQPGLDYVIGVDVAAGYHGGDYSAMVVLDKQRLELAAIWHGHLDPDLLAEEAALLGRYYNQALLVPEANNHGVAVVSGLRRLHYNHVFRRANGERGFLTTSRSKRQLIADLAAYLRQDAGRARDRPLLAECLSYVYDDKGATNARPGSFDDRVMALALAVHVAGQVPAAPPLREENWRAAYGAYESTGY